MLAANLLVALFVAATHYLTKGYSKASGKFDVNVVKTTFFSVFAMSVIMSVSFLALVVLLILGQNLSMSGLVLFVSLIPAIPIWVVIIYIVVELGRNFLIDKSTGVIISKAFTRLWILHMIVFLSLADAPVVVYFLQTGDIFVMRVWNNIFPFFIVGMVWIGLTVHYGFRLKMGEELGPS
jgi:hypothetical protein